MKRIQRKRTKGWQMPPNTIYVGRPSQWGNPYTLRDGLLEAAKDFHDHPKEEYANDGKDLACWCPLNQPCHADILIEICQGINPTV